MYSDKVVLMGSALLWYFATICPWMDGIRAMHMYRTYGIRAMQGAIAEEQRSGVSRRSTQAMAIVLVKCCNAVAKHHSNARRVDLSTSMAALCLLQRTMAICCEACLTLNADRPTEHINTALSEYSHGAV